MSPKTVADKLLIKPDTTVWVSDDARLALVGPLPEGVTRVDGLQDATTALLFADDAASLRALLADHAGDLAAPDVLWVAYEKGNRSDINRDSAWPIVAEHGMRPIGQVALDDVWSALRFRPLRRGEPQFSGGR